jgi:D-glycero-beta-D-manno-heptose-7-phosphate kinase
MNNNYIIDKLKLADRFRMLVIGDVMLDEYTFCTTANSKNINSEMLGKKAYLANSHVTAPGGAANVAVNLRALGVTTSLLGIVGCDGYDAAIRRECEKHGIATILISDKDRPTTVKRRIYVDDEYFFRIDNESTEPVNDSLANCLINEFQQRIDEVNVVIISDYNKGVFTSDIAFSLVRACNQRGIPLVIDCKPVNAKLFRGAKIIIPNLVEATELLPEFDVQNKLETHIKNLYTKLMTQKIAVTLGNQGICGFDGENFYRVNGIPVKVKDTVGAGDTVRSAIAVGFALGFTFPEILNFANIVASIVVQKTGTAFVTVDEIASNSKYN